jgi:NAD(P)-dependent dehydrogenase (short-subunit alcohol dehydrogenase family)
MKAMAGRFAGKVALVTGGGSGIGRAAASAFAREGANVVVAGRGLERLHETVRLIEETGGHALPVAVDVARAAEVEAMVEKTVQTYGRLDYAFNNAGGFYLLCGRPALTADIAEEDWDHIVDINLKGIWLCMKYEIPQMLKRGGGAIVNTSSTDGQRGGPYRASYVAAKHGVIGLTKTAALEYAKQGIRVNAVCPGWIRTLPVKRRIQDNPDSEQQIIAQQPIGRLGEPEEIAEAVVWLCSDAASFVTGDAMAVDGGQLA